VDYSLPFALFSDAYISKFVKRFFMKHLEKVPAVVLLEDGTFFYGYSAGKIGTTFGEICFNTGMTGYQEVFTDPSYFGQILVTTNVHIGNYGISEVESESNQVQIAGLITRNYTNAYSRKMADGPIQDYLIQHGLVAITDIDTRAIVRHIRSKGAMNAVISSETLELEVLMAKLKAVPSMEGLELASKVSTQQAYELGEVDAPFRVAVLDYGAKRNILRSLAERGCLLRVFPHHSSVADIMPFQPNGIMLSNGPGDPAVMTAEIKVIQEILQHDVPVFGICLGHQLLASAMGVKTFKMHHGHRGINHPVKNLLTGKSEITSQNHGFGVDPASVRSNDQIEITHLNLNDDTIEGIRLKYKKAFSVQYHPEACPGPHDSRYLFDDFIKLMQA
jgi:carbamoyl-phosphate synthase small subunit